MRRGARGWLWGILLPGLMSCAGPQSALSPAGRDAERIATLFFWMAGGAVVIWLGVMGSAIWTVVRPERAHSKRTADLFIVGGGVALPTVTLTVLVFYGLRMMPGLLHPGPDLEPRIAVSAEQFWWRVTYRVDGAEPVELANEIHVPIDRRTSFALTSPDVIHSFWVPSLAGKVDAIPGRETHLAFEPTRAGVFRGACAEYCGVSHAWMSFHVVVSSREDHEAWLRRQAEPAQPPEGPLETRGAELFQSSGCGACHTVRGTPADGVIGPDLTHVGSRQSLAAGALDNDVDGFERWLTATDDVKPGVHMPAYDALVADDAHALAAYLEGLQ
ncbi:MAG TPA: cytochrome c oxidase subunit II [Sandaracinaceae bacterium LLY-WYZ-13_1]|nr:cytochrome c oxidase subunit II [Sandaracinaceae bacterium LLY-WYZ-13_1]